MRSPSVLLVAENFHGVPLLPFQTCVLSQARVCARMLAAAKDGERLVHYNPILGWWCPFDHRTGVKSYQIAALLEQGAGFIWGISDTRFDQLVLLHCQCRLQAHRSMMSSSFGLMDFILHLHFSQPSFPWGLE